MSGNDRKRTRFAKLRETDRFRRKLPHCSQTALAALAAETRKNSLPEFTSRKQQREARTAITSMDTSYGPLLGAIDVPDKDGTRPPVKFRLAHPLALLVAAYAMSEKAAKRRITSAAGRHVS